MPFALITGASKGIGRAIALELASRKHDILVVARTEHLLSDLCEVIRENYGVQCNYLAVDLTSADAADQIYEWCIRNSYSIDILVNNAGYGLSGSFENRPIGESLDMINVNVTSVLKLIHLFLPQLRKQPKAYILNLASSAAYQSVPYLSAYAAAKSFVLSFSRGLKHELRNSNVSVTVVSPGVTDTDFATRANVPEKGLKAAEKISMKPDQVAKIAVDSMFSHRAERITGFITKATIFFVKLLPKTFSEKTAAKFYQ
ncbi:MAG: SDR family NAD(P)-dependent oxidoreductase [Flavisolibacter sp.]